MKRDAALEILSKNHRRLQSYQINELYLFGSVARDEAVPDSDVDILVEFNEGSRVGLFQMVKLKSLLSQLLGCRADIVTKDALHPLLKDKILEEAIRAA